MELVVVVVIIGILASVTLINFTRQKKMAHFNSAAAQVREIIAAEKEYALTQGFYVSTDNTSDTNANLAIRIFDDFFHHYRIDASTTPDFIVVTYTGPGNGTVAFTFNSDGVYTGCIGAGNASVNCREQGAPY